MADLGGKHALVTGGGGGVGEAIALMLAGSGARVTVCGRQVPALEVVASKHENIAAQRCDVTDYAAVQQAVNAASQHFGKIDIVIANAGTAESIPFSKMTSEDWSHSIDVNLSGVFNSFKACMPHMEASGWGRMISIASTAGLKGYSYVAQYCAAKHGVIGLTRALSQELAKTGITVNAICPGFTETPMLERSLENIQAKTGMSREEAAKALIRANPMGRFIQPEEIAQTVLWLVGKNSDSISGQALSVSGGEV